ncbi:MAG: hypothetical protein GYB67_18895 [Chloroflexi bacterium]|nr:hypothetical protein [Chloroflexota bacterium]
MALFGESVAYALQPTAVSPTPTWTLIPVSEDPVTPAPTVTWRGPLVGADYSLPPTIPPAATGVVAPAATVNEPPAAGQPTPTIPPPTGPQPTTVPFLDPAQMGIQVDINLDDDDWAEAMRRVQDDLAIGWLKVQIPWEDMQPNGPDQADGAFFRRVELHLQDAQRRGLNVLVSVAKAPLWARTDPTEDGPPDDPQRLAEFVALMLREFDGLIDAVEIWNEPNLIREWRGVLPFNGAGYMQLFGPTYNAIRAYSPTLPIITAGLAPAGNIPGLAVADREYLRQMYAAGLGNYQDVYIGVHPYSWGNAPDATCCGTRGWDDDPHFFFADTLREYRDIMVANGHANRQMWFTEFGWPTWEGFPGEPGADSRWILFNDRWAQANYTIRAFEIGQQTDFIGPMILWNLNFAVLEGLVENGDTRAAYSIVIPGAGGVLDLNAGGLTERPLYWMIYDAVRPDVQLERYD